ncbi:chromate resistance protein ChrB [Paenarthrobacter sp. Z7-10]|uniref:Chromate resistance protein ChrB n=1 Tax=Paenarthrobacter sp. Z7-10 TaxID=2787635 RepID=UPI0022A9996B|nr:Chromate resistance protein ChrB [Paenarthrobacter sp. Z7-10]MCZ2404725.1 chromate resistance protein ChrB [Paenarthrobacter sp. Z7-10]
MTEEDYTWFLILVQIPAQPSRHRVAVWRELRRTGAVPVSPGTWALPALPAFETALERARELAKRGSGTLTVIDAAPRDEAGAELLRTAFSEAREEEWKEFIADCGKFDAEIAREVAKSNFTFGELEEEEQSLDRLRRWYRELKSRDVLRLPQADVAQDHLSRCVSVLDDYAQQVYETVLP